MIPKSKNAKSGPERKPPARRALPSWLSLILLVLLLVGITVVYWVRLRQPNTLTPMQTQGMLQIQGEMSDHFKSHPEQMNLTGKAKVKRGKLGLGSCVVGLESKVGKSEGC